MCTRVSYEKFCFSRRCWTQLLTWRPYSPHCIKLCCTRETRNLSASINDRTSSACIRSRPLNQTENAHRRVASVLSAKLQQTLARNNRETIAEWQATSREENNKRRKENAQKSHKTDIVDDDAHTHAGTSLAHRENGFHFSCSLFIVIIFRIYMFDFIIIRVTSQRENKGAFLFRYETIGLHAFHPTGWNASNTSQQMEYDTSGPYCRLCVCVCVLFIRRSLRKTAIKTERVSEYGRACAWQKIKFHKLHPYSQFHRQILNLHEYVSCLYSNI